jgi:hypothetical protein
VFIVYKNRIQIKFSYLILTATGSAKTISRTHRCRPSFFFMGDDKQFPKITLKKEWVIGGVLVLSSDRTNNFSCSFGSCNNS